MSAMTGRHKQSGQTSQTRGSDPATEIRDNPTLAHTWKLGNRMSRLVTRLMRIVLMSLLSHSLVFKC